MPQPWPFPRVDSLPTYAFVVTDAVKARVLESGADLIDLGLGNPDRPTPRAIVEELHRAADVGQNHRYHPGRGLPILRQAMAHWYQRRYQMPFDIETEIVVTIGAKEGISHLCLALLAPGDVVVVPNPCYPIHQGGPTIAGARVEFYDASVSVPAAQAIADAISRVTARGERPKLVVANYPQNPTGRTLTAAELAELVELVGKSGALLLHDLAYADMDFGPRHAPSIFSCGVDPEWVKSFSVEVFSMSKSYNMPGWRIGYVVGNQRMVGALSHLKTYLDYGTFAPVQYAAAWALEHGDDLASELRELYRGRAVALLEALGQAGFSEVDRPRGTMFVWARLPEPWARMGSLSASSHLIESAHVVASPGIGFGSGGDRHLRFALIEDPPRLREAGERLGALLRKDRG